MPVSREIFEIELKKQEDGLNAEIKRRNAKRRKIYCPIRDGKCRISCESYDRPIKIKGEDIKKPYVNGGNCTAFILKGLRC